MVSIRVVLVEPEGEINVGFIARVMKNFNFYDLIIVNPKCSLELAKNYASHGIKVLERAKIVRTIEEAIKGSSLIVATSSKLSPGEDILRIPMTLKEFANTIAKYHGTISILFGRESTGLTREEITKSHMLLTIPASSNYPSLNLSHAVAIVLYEIFSEYQQEKQHVVKKELPREEELKALHENIEKAVRALKMPNHKKEKTILTLKRIFGRAIITAHETYVLSGFFRRVHTQCGRKDEHDETISNN